MASLIRPLKRALISLSDKTGLIDAAHKLVAAGAELISTGGTSKALKEAGFAVKDVADLTGFPEMMDGRVKTLHPMVHGGLLALRDLPDHASAMAEYGIGGIDLLWVNLYPFEATLAAGGDFDHCVENIDIGGPAMIRAGAKNHQYCAVATDFAGIELVLADVAAHGGTTHETRKTLAAGAYGRTACYDAAISNWYYEQLGEECPPWRAIGGPLVQSLRYGENPHQSAGFYRAGMDRPGVASATQIQGKELSFNNLNDTNAAVELVAELGAHKPAVAIIKHANPCGVAVGENLESAYLAALACDPVSAFGGIIATNQKLDGKAATEMVKIFTEVVIAPDADDEAKAIFATKKNLRLLLCGALPNPADKALDLRTISGGLLVQGRDNGIIGEADLKLVTKRGPTPSELADLLLAFKIAKHVKSNAIVYVKDGASAGIGAGQMNRRDSARIAAQRAKEAAILANWPQAATIGSACASDAFFPFPDGLMEAAEAGATAIIQPGGSIRDEDVIKAADEAGLAMVFTGMRHFKH